jgi:hypothetical protein
MPRPAPSMTTKAARSTNSVDMAPDQRELIALCPLAGLGFGVALAHGDLLFAAFWRCHRNDEGRRRLGQGERWRCARSQFTLHSFYQLHGFCLGRGRYHRQQAATTPAAKQLTIIGRKHGERRWPMRGKPKQEFLLRKANSSPQKSNQSAQGAYTNARGLEKKYSLPQPKPPSLQQSGPREGRLAAAGADGDLPLHRQAARAQRDLGHRRTAAQKVATMRPNRQRERWRGERSWSSTWKQGVRHGLESN